MKPASAKAKGRRFQAWVCQQISNLTGLPWGKDQPIASREMGHSGTDVRLTGEARKLFPYTVECKAVEKLSIWAAIEQAKDSCAADLPNWLLFCKRNREKPVVVLDAELFFELMEGRK